jgi:hypothetical protein
VIDRLPALTRRREHDLEVLAQPGLTDELGEVARPQRRLLGGLDGIGRRTEQLFSHRPGLRICA